MKYFLTVFACMFLLPGFAQLKPNWHNLDLQQDSLFGISTEKAYITLLKDKRPQHVIIAVIDGGVDSLHEDLKGLLDPHGWSFIGSAKGNVRYDNNELTRQVRQQGLYFAGKDTSHLHGGALKAYYKYLVEKQDVDKQHTDAVNTLNGMRNFRIILDTIVQLIGKDSPTLADFKAYKPSNSNQQYVKKIMIESLNNNDDYKNFRSHELEGPIEHFHILADYRLNTAYDPRPVYVGDHYFNSKERHYGNADYMGPDARHGTHVAGIIAAKRDNGIGMNGVADDVTILPIRVVPDGDERDKDVANAIRYAADHGAKVINISFGKYYSQDKKAVDKAVKYALRKDVLIIQAAGNENKNIDMVPSFPSRRFLNGKTAGAYIVVGASGAKNDSTLKASFSNFGQTAVDVFAPGVQIYSCIPGQRYDSYNGTSMASPVVAGLAALIREYYPKLSAKQVKEIILASVVKSPYLAKYCITGGVVNAYEALLLAAKYR